MRHPRIMLISEAAQYLGRTEDFVRLLVAEQRVSSEMIGRRRYIPRADLDAICAGKATGPEADRAARAPSMPRVI